MIDLTEFLIVGIGGFLGSCARFSLTKLSACLKWNFPLGTLLSNVIAGILIGLIIGLEPHVLWITPKKKLFLTTGLLGGLSTFSTFSLETINLFSDGKYLMALGNILLNLALSLFGVILGMCFAKMVLKKV
ncbi:putative fluoride ion transporter CrcB [bioreactor metagenome]|uniref:Putative fluoride ion transporter CrcB n=1 Tax=bioreactor metagenome TaxID=1076179 RepID=A0A645CM61_9ZZZZ